MKKTTKLLQKIIDWKMLFFKSIKVFENMKILSLLLFIGVLTIYSNNSYAQSINQSKIISGIVSDEAGEPLPGTTVSVKGTTKGVTTDLEGKYELQISSGAKTLVFSFIGKVTKVVAIESKTIINIILLEDSYGLDEIIVVGYGTVKKSDITGSISSVSSEELNRGVSFSAQSALQGKAAGVQVTKTSGDPGKGAIIRIRGLNSISGNNAPLWVIDGIPSINAAEGISPADIESMEILKDASATAIYGARGANGVILVTTKKGKKGISEINFESYGGIQLLDKKLELTNAVEWATMLNEASVFNGGDEIYDTSTLGVGTDWQNELYTTAEVQNYQLSISGGNEKTNYFISGNYFDTDGIIRNSAFKRYSLRANISTEVTNKLTAGVNLNISRSKSNRINSIFNSNDKFEVISLALTAVPIIPVYDVNGKPTLYTDLEGRRGNPIGLADEEVNEGLATGLRGNVFAEYEFMKGLKFRTSLGFNLNEDKTNRFSPNTNAAGIGANGIGSVASVNRTYWVSNNILSYEKTYGKNVLNALAGFTIEESITESVIAGSSDFISQTNTFNDLSASNPENYTADTGYTRRGIMSYLGRVNYIINSKYIFTLTGRYDGASVFAENNKWGFFPSAAVGWRINEEAFMKDIENISNLKLRASFGKTGEQAISPYRSLASFSSAAYSLGTGGSSQVLGQYLNRLSNPDLRWEETTQLNVGLDLGLLKNRINITADYYQKNTSDLLYEISLPNTTGFTKALVNSGEIDNRGFEFGLYAKILTGEFKWDVNFNISFNRNEVLKLDGIKDFDRPSGGINSGNLSSDASRLQIGEPIGIFYGYLFDGIDPENGDLLVKDINDDSVINAEDRTIMGDPNPDHFGGITNTFKYKKFDLTIFANWSYGNDIFWLGKIYNMWADNSYNFSKEFFDNRWTPTNTNASYPRAGYDPRKYTDNSFNVHDGSYFRISNITLGYNVPLKSNHSLRVYFNADNPFTFTKYQGYGPDVSAFGGKSIAQGVDLGVYPVAKTFLIGLNFGL